MSQVNFQEQVIARSHELPVVVDFWASWCGPCRVLGPIIEGLAAEANGRWELVKVDTEANREVSQQYRIMSIPAVKMFHKGQVIAEFAGALPKPQIQAWLDEHIPNPDKLALQALTEDWVSQNPEEWRNALQQYHQAHPESDEARAWYALSLLSQEPAGALGLIEDLHEGHKQGEIASDVRTLAELLQTTPVGGETFVQAFQKAQEAFRTHHIEQALEHLIETVMYNKGFAEELPRRATVALFRLLGQSHPLSKQFQRRFSMALY